MPHRVQFALKTNSRNTGANVAVSERRRRIVRSKHSGLSTPRGEPSVFVVGGSHAREGPTRECRFPPSGRRLETARGARVIPAHVPDPPAVSTDLKVSFFGSDAPRQRIARARMWAHSLHSDSSRDALAVAHFAEIRSECVQRVGTRRDGLSSASVGCSTATRRSSTIRP
jgi:hypothetical protein